MYDDAPDYDERPSPDPAQQANALTKKIRSWINSDYSARRDWRREAMNCYAYYAGEQYTPDDRDALEAAGREAIEFNRIQAIVDAAVGQGVNNRSDIVYRPRSLGQAGKNEVLTQGVEHFRDEADADQEETQAEKDQFICGVGVVEHRIDYDEDPQGRLVVQRYDPLMAGVDHRARRPGYTDAQRCWVAQEMSLADAQDLFPDAEPGHLDAKWWRGHYEHTPAAERVDTIEDEHENGLDSSSSSDDVSSSVIILQVQWRERRTVVSFMPPDGGEEMELSAEVFAELSQRYAMMTGGQELFGAPREKWVYYQAFIGRKVLEWGEAASQTGFSFKFITGYWDNKKRCHYGIVRNLRSPQMWLNRTLTQLLHILNATAKGGIMVEEDAVEDPDRFERDYAASDTVIWLEPGGKDKIAPKVQTSLPQAIDSLITFADQMIYKVSGLSPEMLGLSETNQQVAAVEYQRRQSSMAVLATFMDGKRLYLKQVGELMLDYVRRYVSPETLVRIVGDEGEQFVPLAYAGSHETRFDVMIDEAPSSPNAKERNWSIIQSLLPMVQDKMSAGMWADILRSSPLPAWLTEKLSQRLMAMEDPEAAEQQQAEFDRQKQNEDRLVAVQEVKADADKVTAQANARFKEAQAIDLLRQLPGEMRKDQADAEKDIAYARAVERRKLEIDEMDRRERRAIEARKIRLDERRMDQDREMKAADLALRGGELATNVSESGALDFLRPDMSAQNAIAQQMTQQTALMTQMMQAMQETMAGVAQSNQDLARVIAAPSELVRDQSGRAIGQRRVL